MKEEKPKEKTLREKVDESVQMLEGVIAHERALSGGKIISPNTKYLLIFKALQEIYQMIDDLTPQVVM